MKRRSVLKKQSVKRRRGRRLFPLLRVIQGVGAGFFKVSVLICVIGIVSLSFLSFYHYFLASPYMKLWEVEMEGVDGRLKQELIGLGGVQRDTSLLALRLNEIKRKMETHPWVRSVTLERRFPHTLRVVVEKERAIALILTDRFFYMNPMGEIFKEVDDSDEMDFPIITGLSTTGGEMGTQLTSAARILKFLSSQKGFWSVNQLSEIHFRKGGEMSLYFSHLPAEIRLTCRDLPSKIYGLKRVMGHLRENGKINLVTAVDLNHPGGILVSFKKS